jgi:hypothetical protein
MSNKATTEEVLKILHDQFDWNLTDSLTTTGEKLVADTIKALSLVKQQQDKNKYSKEELRQAIRKARDITDGKDCFDAEDISGCTEVCTYDWKFNLSEDLIIEQFKKK